MRPGDARRNRLPVTVKTRIGIDERDDYDFLRRFVDAVAAAGCRTLILHARKAWLSGLSPKQNREIPPLRYEVVHRVKADFPELEVIVNGGIRTLDQALAQLAAVDGVMIGREAYHNPYVLAEWERALLGVTEPVASRFEVARRLLPYIERELAQARRCTRSPGTSSACSTVCPAPAPGAGTCRRPRFAPAPGRRSSWPRSTTCHAREERAFAAA